MEDQTCIPQNFNYHRKIGQTYVWYAQLEHGYSMLCEMMQYQFVKKHKRKNIAETDEMNWPDLQMNMAC